jgi:uncharacterized protein YacL
VAFLGLLLVAAVVIVLDMSVRRKPLDTISAVYFGLIVGLLLSYVAGLAMTPLFAPPIADTMMEQLKPYVQLVLGAILCYACISLLMQTKNDFRFIIPYVEFSKEVKGRRPYIIDTSAVIDGRIADVVEANIFDSQLIMPRFVIMELQGIADSSDRLRRSRGRRGLDILNKLRANPQVDLEIYDRELPEFAGQTVDLKLVALAKHLEGKLITNDFNLNKVAELQGVQILNINRLASALKPVVLAGEEMTVKIIREGKEPGQGVGYLDDGTMVVVEHGKKKIGSEVTVIASSVLQTPAGKMIFTDLKGDPQEG